MGSEFDFLREASNKKLNKSLQIVFISILEIRSQYDITYDDVDETCGDDDNDCNNDVGCVDDVMMMMVVLMM